MGFGDGSPPQDGVSVTHTFSDTGAHTVTLTVSDSAGRSDTATEQLAGCQPEAVVGALHAQGCLFDDSDRWLAVGSLSINGLQLAPVGRVSASLYKNPVRLAVNGTVAIKAGGRTLWQGPALGWSTADTLRLKIPAGTELYGLPLTGDLSLSLSAEDGGAVDGEASADLGGITADALLDPLKAGGLLRAALEPEGHASVKLRWSRDRGFELDHVSLVGKRLQLGAAAAPFSLSDFNLTYEHSGNDNIFTGEAGFGGPFSPIVRPKVTIVNGQLAGIGLAVDQLNEPLPPPAEARVRAEARIRGGLVAGLPGQRLRRAQPRPERRRPVRRTDRRNTQVHPAGNLPAPDRQVPDGQVHRADHDRDPGRPKRVRVLERTPPAGADRDRRRVHARPRR